MKTISMRSLGILQTQKSQGRGKQYAHTPLHTGVNVWHVRGLQKFMEKGIKVWIYFGAKMVKSTRSFFFLKRDFYYTLSVIGHTDTH